MTSKIKHNIITGTQHNWYSADGLECHFDAILNDKDQHASSSSVWKDLCNDAHDATLAFGMPSWTSNSLVCTSTGCTFLANVQEFNDSWTVEVCVTPSQDAFQNYKGIVGGTSNSSSAKESLIMCQYENGKFRIGTYGSQPGGIPAKSFAIGSFNDPSTWPSAQQIMTTDLMTTLSLVVDRAVMKATLLKDGKATQHCSLLANGIGNWDQQLLYIGAGDSNGEGSKRCFTGKIHSVRVYSKAISAREAALNFSIDCKRFASDG